MDGPGCEAGAPCADADGDGFSSCTCAPPGTRCDCNDQDPTVYPGAPEACNSTKDEGCDGEAGGGCKTGQGCLDGLCVPECRPLDDFGCDNGSYCFRSSIGLYCKPPDCRTFGCPPGQTCNDANQCVPNCSPDVRCPHGQVCRGFGCIDPCAGIVCQTGAVCVAGECVPSCTCSGATCPAGQSCGPSGVCVETACLGIVCPAGEHCERGACVDTCAGVICPAERVCRMGQCVDLCSPDPCRTPDVCDWRTAACIPPPRADGGLAPPNAADDEIVVIAGAGFTCTTAHLAGATGAGLVACVLAALFVSRRLSPSRRSPCRRKPSSR